MNYHPQSYNILATPANILKAGLLLSHAYFLSSMRKVVPRPNSEDLT